MALGRGSAISSLVLFSFILLPFEMAHAATFTVGDARGWTFNTVGWPQGKQFRAGDILVFNYPPGVHNVVVVDKGGYDACQAPKGAKIFQSGKDQVTLAKGDNYFLCSFPGHCNAGMKIFVNAF